MFLVIGISSYANFPLRSSEVTMIEGSGEVLPNTAARAIFFSSAFSSSVLLAPNLSI